jgi:peptide-methionine (R)-S-oxide reductase
MNRRLLLTALVGGPVGLLVERARGAEVSVHELRTSWRELLPEGATVPSPADQLTLTEDEWRARLEPERFAVLREEATEPAFSSPLNDQKRPGIYTCAGCDLPLFSSAMKFDSGTGWPSFFTTIPAVFETKRDFVWLLPRTEYHCVRCGGHHGHVFDDGPAPTRERWCNNGVALRFVPASAGGA